MDSLLATRLAALRERMRRVLLRAGRTEAGLRLVAVTKYYSAEVALAATRAGLLDLGESRAQELMPKAARLSAQGARPNWHFLGHLQRNKVRQVLQVATWIHSVDSLRLLEALDREATALRVRPRILLELQSPSPLGSERTGFLPSELTAAVAQAAACKSLILAGLMSMAPAPIASAGEVRSGSAPTPAALSGDQPVRDTANSQAVATAWFQNLAQWRERLPSSAFEGGKALLSMGMSSDFEAAIGCGADILRIGSLLFEGLEADQDQGSKLP